MKEIPEDIVKKLADLSIITCQEFISAVHLEGYSKSLGVNRDRFFE